MLRTALLAGAASALLPGLALAQTNAAAQDDAQQPSGPAASTAVAAVNESAATAHADHAQEIVVTGFRRNREDILSGTSVVTGAELTRDLRPTIGETLARQPGVSATAFGPNASRPVLRGFQGERVRVLTDGIGSLDASNTSVDHAVAVNPLTAERIEVLRGPAALLFGSSAIGGVVNVIDARIPRRVPDEAAHVDGILTYGSAANERSANATIDVPLGGSFVLHADGNYSNTDDLEIGGHVLARALRSEAAASGDPAIRALADLKGKLPNTAAETSDVALGAAWISGENNVGFSINRYDSLYGVPIRYSLDPQEEPEAPRIDIKQTRVDGRAEIDTGSGFVDQVRVRGGYSDYRHDELEDTGEIGTTFLTKGAEGRVELVQSQRGGWGGGFGAQYFRRHLDVIGEEKFLPESRTSQFGLFTLQNYRSGRFRAEVGARYEHQKVSAEADADLGNEAERRSFDSWSGSAGASYEIAPGLRLGVNGSHSQRAPSAEELFANGPHAGTQAFEVGDPDLSQEKSWGLEGTLSAQGDGYSLSASVFRSWFDDYIYEARTGAVEDGLPVFQIGQADARYFGIEFEGSLRVARVGGFAVNLDGVADYVRATIDSVGPAPRIPPLRLLGGIEAQSERLQARAEIEWTDEQDRLAPLETPTAGFTLVNASVSWQPLAQHPGTSLTVSANNIFDVDARRHASFLKDVAPLAGRDVRLTARLSF
ncbi:TonB-dependent receptor [Sphingosinicella sp. BN140058]|uniref:TonB-dependent receptor n=1 Tax=Sphingosinicella sp. BN140058 TaxID=1892855 RepID=UPI0010127B37|nr:TonB-dependent receptor [Sphingosinicella sp. BN140058]QAY75946.1 TonB-dependent receptor [Sphingosinicella sp. BN140058]